jgi:hypothetical protein
MAIDEIRRALRELAMVLDREARETRLRNFERLSALLRRKEHLIEICEQAFADAAFGAEARNLMREFEAVRRKAEENAQTLVAIRKGFVDARARLEALHQADAKTGLYSPLGGEIRDRAASAHQREV